MLFYSFLAVLDAEDRSFAEQLFEKYHKYIYEIVYNILNNHQDSEDTVDEVMINIMKNIDRFNNASGNDIVAQIVIYSRHAAINLYNKNKRRNKIEGYYTYVNDENEFEGIEYEDTSETVEERIITQETVEIVRKYLTQLTPEHRDIIKLVFVLGYTNVQAARVLHITPNAVGLRLFKAKKKLLELAGGELNERI